MREEIIHANVECYTQLFSQAGTDPACTNAADERAAWALSQIPQRLAAGDIPGAMLWLGFVHGIALATGRATAQDIAARCRPPGTVPTLDDIPTNPEKLKVYIDPNVDGRLMGLVAAKSIAEACKLLRVNPYGFRQMGGGVSSRDAYVRLALSYPRQPLWREIHPPRGEEDAWHLDRALVLDRHHRRRMREP